VTLRTAVLWLVTILVGGLSYAASLPGGWWMTLASLIIGVIGLVCLGFAITRTLDDLA